MTRITPGILLELCRLSTWLPTFLHCSLTFFCRQAEWTDWVAVAVNHIYRSLLYLWKLVFIWQISIVMRWSKFLLFQSILAVEFLYAMYISFYSYISRYSWEKSHFLNYAANYAKVIGIMGMNWWATSNKQCAEQEDSKILNIVYLAIKVAKITFPILAHSQSFSMLR